MYKRIVSAEEIEERNKPFECGADVLKSILQSFKELSDYEIDVIEMYNGGVEITIGDSIYSIERNF